MYELDGQLHYTHPMAEGTVSEGRHRTQNRREDRELWVTVPRGLYLARPLTTFAGDLFAEFRP